MNSVEGLTEQRYAQLQGSVNGMRKDIGALTAHMGNQNNSITQTARQLREFDHTLGYQEDSVQHLLQRADDTQQALQANQAELHHLRHEQQQTREEQQNTGSFLQTQMNEILARLDRQSAAIAMPVANSWSALSAGPSPGPSSSSYSRSQPFGSAWGLSSYQSAAAMDAEPTPPPPRDYWLSVNRPIQVPTPPTVPSVTSTLGGAPRPVEAIDLDPSAQRANEPAICTQPVGPQPEQAGSKKILGSAMKSISQEKFSGRDKDQDMDDWINQMDRFMRVAHVDESLQVDLAASCLTGSHTKPGQALIICIDSASRRLSKTSFMRH